ncbi:MAG: FAD-dependent oxidoreductase [Christensenellales bacterium]
MRDTASGEDPRTIADCEVLVLGGTLQAMMAALDQAERGRRVMLVTEDTCLYSEIATRADYRRPLGLDRAAMRRFFPEAVFQDEGLLHPDRLKRHGESMMAKQGVALLYACQCVGFDEKGALLAHKSGLLRVAAGEVRDCRGRAPLRAPCFCLHYRRGDQFHQMEVPCRDAQEGWTRALETLHDRHPQATPARSGWLPSESAGICYDPAPFTPLTAAEEQADIIVAGGGTSGALAALHAARQGKRTLLLEMNPCLGGTATLGGVSAYWFGLRGGASREIDAAVAGVYERFGYPRRPHIWTSDDVFLPDIKAHVLQDLCQKAGVEIRFGSTVCGVIKEAGRVTGLHYARGGALHSARCGMLVDCTGDGDCAVFAGADYTYGNEQDMMTYWASLAQYPTPDSYRNNFSTMVRVDDALDYTRFILAARGLGEDPYDHGQYLAVRESRHIRGLETLTLPGILGMQIPERTLYTCFSNYDPKGRLTAELVYFGLLPPNQMIPIPLGAVIPLDREGRPIAGLLVGGKAISCTHDAFPGIRMQPDMQQQGLALGVLAAQCLLQGEDAWHIGDISRQILLAGGQLPPLPRQAAPDLQTLIDGLDGDEPLEWLDAPPDSCMREVQPLIALFLAPDEALLPGLRAAFGGAEGRRRLLLARLLLWHGDECGAGDIIREIERLLEAAPGLPGRQGSLQYGQMLPDHGLMPEAVYLLNSLSRTRCCPVAPLFHQVLRRLLDGPRDWYDLRAGIYCYVECFPFVGGARADRDFLPLLRTLCGMAEFTSQPEDALLAQRLGMLRIALLAARWGLGDLQAGEELERMTADPCRALALAAGTLRHARDS